jgi:hypothetical protein
MTELFGGSAGSFRIPEAAPWLKVMQSSTLYNLYHALNHANLWRATPRRPSGYRRSRSCDKAMGFPARSGLSPVRSFRNSPD